MPLMIVRWKDGTMTQHEVSSMVALSQEVTVAMLPDDPVFGSDDFYIPPVLEDPPPLPSPGDTGGIIKKHLRKYGVSFKQIDGSPAPEGMIITIFQEES